jgi:hypothetical protein
MSKTIYVIGDSFSAGAELEDHTFNSFYKFNPKNPIEHFKWATSKDYQIELESRKNYDKYESELKRAWPAKLASLANVNVINHSFGGSGPAMWRAKVFLDLLNFKKNDIKVDTAIIQISEYNRDCIFDTLPNGARTTYNNIGIRKYLNGSSIEKAYLKLRLALESEYGYFFRFLLDISSIKTSLLNFGITEIEIISHNSSTLNDWKNLEFINNPDIQSLLSYLGINLDIPITAIWEYTKTDPLPPILPGSHYPEYIHNEFAKLMKFKLNL